MGKTWQESRERSALIEGTIALHEVERQIPKMDTAHLNDIYVRCICERALLIISTGRDAQIFADALGIMQGKIADELLKRKKARA